MKYKVLLHAEALDEYIPAAKWHQDQKPGLGDQFIHAIKERLEFKHFRTLPY